MIEQRNRSSCAGCWPTTFCQEVTNSDYVWPAVVTNVLQDNYPSRQFDYINASVTGFTTKDSLVNLNDRAAQLEPDIIFIYHAINDIADNHWYLAKSQGVDVFYYPWQWLTKPMKKSVLVNLTYNNVRILLANNKNNKTAIKAKYDDEYMVSRLSGNLQNLVDRALEISSYVVIPTFATQLRENQTPEQKIIAAQTLFHSLPYMELKDIVTVIQSYNDVIRELGERENVIVIETESEIAGTQEMFFDSVHFTDEGSKRLGRHIAKHVSDSNILK